jgi:hypothetical protein
MKPSHYLLLLLLFTLSSCTSVTWKRVPPEVIATVPANDGSEVAIAIQSYEINKIADKKPSLGLARNYEHQIFIQNHDGSQQRAMTVKRPYQLTTLHYPKTAGYLVAGYIVNTKDNIVRYEKIDLQTGQVTFIRNDSGTSQPMICKGLFPQSFVVEGVSPSPDGLLIAYFYSPSCFKTIVDFIDARTLTLLDKQQVDIRGVNQVTWQPQQGLILYPVTETQGNTAWRLLPKTPPMTTHFTPQ